MRILTVRQPWAWAIIHGGKDVENRVRNLAGDYRGPVAIHAGKTFDEEAEVRSEVLSATLNVFLDSEDPNCETLPMQWPWRADDAFGAILGVVDLVDVHFSASWGGECYHGGRLRPICSDWAERGPAICHLTFANPRPLVESIPYKGALGLRRFNETVDAEILRQLAEVA